MIRREDQKRIAAAAVLIFTLILVLTGPAPVPAQGGTGARARDIGLRIGDLPTGKLNAITDVAGVKVGNRTIIEGKGIRTGVTAILPHPGNLFAEKVPAALFVGNGFGKMSGISQIEELGNIETPIILTNTLNVGTAVEAVVRYTLNIDGNEEARSVNAVVGETNDGYLNDIRSMRVAGKDVIEAIESASAGAVSEGAVGAGTGTVAFGFKGGMGTSSRIVSIPGSGDYTVGVLVQANYSGSLKIGGIEIDFEPSIEKSEGEDEGSCMIIIATDAPLSVRNLKRLAARGMHGLARTGSYMSNGSGDYAIAFSTAYRISAGGSSVNLPGLISNNRMNGLFTAVVDAVEESVYNSLFMAEDMTGFKGRTVRAIPVGKVAEILAERGRIPAKGN